MRLQVEIHSSDRRFVFTVNGDDNMNIQGLQKLTLLDYPGHTACTVFLKMCDFRCPFCHNSLLLDASCPDYSTDTDLLNFLKKRVGLLDGVCFTGGEPLLHNGLSGLISKIKEMGFLVKLDTNGYHPDVLKQLIDAKLIDYVAMDIKNSPDKYALTCGRENIDMNKIYSSIGILKNSGIEYEFRTTVVKSLHEESDFEPIGRMISGADNYYLQCFVDCDTVLQKGLEAPSKEHLNHFCETVAPYVKNVQIRGI